jgi:hypothetical protein
MRTVAGAGRTAAGAGEDRRGRRRSAMKTAAGAGGPR